MRAMIIGAGNAGRLLAERLCGERHDVVVIDRKKEPLTALEAQLDVMTVRGPGANPATLAEAGLAGTDLLVAVTNQDETNLLACAYGKAAGVPFRIARLTHADFMAPDSPLSPEQLGVNLCIRPKHECARDIARLLRLPGAQEVVPLLDGKLLLVGFEIGPRSRLLGIPLQAFPEPELLSHMRFVAVQRGERVSIPQGATQFLAGDKVYAVGVPEMAPSMLSLKGDAPPRIRKAVIAGGGDLGIELARRLEKDGFSVVLIEQSEQRANECAAELADVLVVRADVLDIESLQEAGIAGDTAYIAATGDEENNIISCLLAQKVGAGLTMTQISTPEYVPIINSLNLLDRAVSPHLSTVNAILRFVRGRNVKAATVLQTLPGEMIEVALDPGSPWVGKAIRDLKLPRDAIIVAMQRGDDVHVPTGAMDLAAGDSLVLYAVGAAVHKLNSIFQP